MINKIISILDRICRLSISFNMIGVATLFAMAVLTFIDVAMRYFFHKPISGSYEITELMLVIIVFMGLANGQLDKSHVAMDLVTGSVSSYTKLILKSVTSFISIILFAVVAWQAFRAGQNYLDIGIESQTRGIPLAPFVFVTAFGFFLLELVLVKDFLINMTHMFHKGKNSIGWLLFVFFSVLWIILGIIWMSPDIFQLSPAIVGTLSIIIILLLFLTGMPISFVLIMVSMLSLSRITGIEASMSAVGIEIYRTSANYTWAVLALFLFMGFVVAHSRLGADLYQMAYRWIGHFPGGLGAATIGASTGFATVAASNLSTIVAMGTVALPEMEKYGYDKSLSSGCVAAGSSLGPLIPPSIGFVIYSLLTRESIGDLFLAGIFPGIILSLAFILTIYLICKARPEKGPVGERSNWKLRFESLKWCAPIAVLFILVIGGIYAGIFTPTEGGGIGAFGALTISGLLMRFRWKSFVYTITEATKIISMLFLLLGGSLLFGYLMAVSGVGRILAEFVSNLNLSPMTLLVGILAMYFVIGFFVEAVATMLITVPILHPIIVNLGLDPIWFGVLVNLMINLAMISPPFGTGCFALKGIARDIPMADIFRGVIPFILSTMFVVALVTAFPVLATWLPYLIK